MTNLAAGLGYAGFVLLALITIIAGRREDAAARRWATRFIAYVLAVSFLAGITQRDLWPFSSWRLMQRIAPTEVSDTGFGLIRSVGITASGIEYPIDYRAWEPFSREDVTWRLRNFRTTHGPTRDSISAFVIGSVEAARLAARAGEWPGAVTRRLGSFAAPGHLLFARTWRQPDDVPDSPFVAIRLYWEHWNIEERAHDPRALRETLLDEFPSRP